MNLDKYEKEISLNQLFDHNKLKTISLSQDILLYILQRKYY